MEKRTLLPALALTATCVFASPAFAATTNFVTADKLVRVDDVLINKNAPLLVIEASYDIKGDQYFMLELENAKWLYEGSGTISEGISYTRYSKSLIAIQVDGKLFDASAENIVIPLTTEITGSGMATVTIKPGESGVSEETLTFAHVNFPGMAVNVSHIDNINGTFDVSFKDDYPYQMPNSRLFKMQITNGFEFVSAEKAEGTGKYSDKVEFKIDYSNPAIAYVATTEPSSMSAGTMEIKGVQVASTSKTREGSSAYLTIEPMYGDGSSIKYELANFKSQEAVKEYKTIEFTIGGNYYVVEEDTLVPIDDAPYVDVNGRTMLPLRALANAFDIADENIVWNPSSQTVTIKNKLNQEINVAIGSEIIKLDGVEKKMDTMAVIKNGRTYLPVRPVLNAMGVSDDDIDWNSRENRITVNYRY